MYQGFEVFLEAVTRSVFEKPIYEGGWDIQKKMM
jgi:hypothetical protein